MKPLWTISGRFFGWVSSDGLFYDKTGKRLGTVLHDVLYNHKANYIGEIIADSYIGFNAYHANWMGAVCSPQGKISNTPLEDKQGIQLVGFSDPSLC